MRLIDADRLKEVFRRNIGHDFSEFIDIQPTVDIYEHIKAEIEQFVALDKADILQIIDKYR